MPQPTHPRPPALGSGRVADARGRVVSLLDPGPLWLSGSQDPVDTQTLARIMEDLGVRDAHARARLRLGIGILVMVVLLATAFIAGTIAREGAAAMNDLLSSLVITGPGLIATVIAGCVLPILAARKKRFQYAKNVMLRHGHCPHCGYGIRDVPPDPADGAVVCPECAGAWDLKAALASPATAPLVPAVPNRARVTVLLVLVALMLLGVGVFLFLVL